MIYPPKDAGDPYRVRLAPLTDAEVVHALGGYRGHRMTWACAVKATAALFDRIVNKGDLDASPHRATFAAGLDRYELADRAIDRALDRLHDAGAGAGAALSRPCSRCGNEEAETGRTICCRCHNAERHARGTHGRRQAVPFAEREAKRRARADALAGLGI